MESPIGDNPAIHPNSASLVNAIADNDLLLTSDPDQYAQPLYLSSRSTPRRTVQFSGYYSTYDAGDDSRVGHGFAPTIPNIPIPDNVQASEGSDGQVIIWDPVEGTEYGFWRFERDAGGNYFAQNGYRYHTGESYNGRFADGLAGRGAKLPYFSGLVRKWEVDQGRIDHALSFAYDSPSPEFVYPAGGSDGVGVVGIDVPEGTRLQLNPSLTDADFNRWGLSPTAKVIAKALQEYGMYVVDNSGSSKIFMEDRLTAGWDSSVNRSILSAIPWSEFRVVQPPPQP